MQTLSYVDTFMKLRYSFVLLLLHPSFLFSLYHSLKLFPIISIPSNAHSFLLSLKLRDRSFLTKLRKPYTLPGIKPQSDTWKASAYLLYYLYHAPIFLAKTPQVEWDFPFFFSIWKDHLLGTLPGHGWINTTVGCGKVDFVERKSGWIRLDFLHYVIIP